jgi:hypothetical protein
MVSFKIFCYQMFQQEKIENFLVVMNEPQNDSWPTFFTVIGHEKETVVKEKEANVDNFKTAQRKLSNNEFLKETFNTTITNEAVQGLSKILISQSRTIKVFWFFSLFLANALNFYFIIASILTYLKYEVSTVREYVVENPSVYPKVTFCNNNQFTTAYALDFLKEINKKVDPKIDIFNTTQMSKLNHSIKETTISEVYNEAVATILGKNFTDDERKKLGHSLDDILFRYFNFYLNK